MAGYIGSRASVTVTSPETDSRYVNVTGDTMTGALKVGTIQNTSGGSPTAADLGLNVTGTVLQIASGYNDTQYAGTATGVWNDAFTFSISGVQSGSKLLIEFHPAGLMEHIEAVLYSVFKNGIEIARSMHNGAGNGGWRTAPTVAIGEDTTPSVGTNTYQVKIYSTSPPWYINYEYPLNFHPRSMWKITEIAQ